MMTSEEDQSIGETPPLEFRRKVFGNNQFRLPAILVREVGYKPRLGPTPKVGWYYNERDNKAVLTDDTVDRSTLQFVASSNLTDTSVEDFTSGDVSGATVTIVNDLPSSLHKKLTSGYVVLMPLYETQHHTLDSTCVSVYPQSEYDRGELPNVDRESIQTSTEQTPEDQTPVVGETTKHQNSV